MGNQTSVEEDIIIKCGLEEMVKQFFEDYMIIWHDPNVDSEENEDYIKKLEKFCEVKTFKEWEKASLEVQQTKAYCHVITSGTNGELLVKEMDKIQRVSAIYVFCANKDLHSQWAINYKRISCVETRMRNIIPQIQQNLMKWYKEASSLKMNLPAFAPIFNDWDKSGMNNLHRYLKVIPRFKSRLQAKNDFLELSKALYLKEKDTKMIALFEKSYKEYNKKETLNWYTQQSFVYRVANKCLRIATSDSIQYCRLLLRDIEQAIKEQYQEKSNDFSGLLYRGAYLSEEEWLNLKNNVNREIEMHGFLSVSKDKNVALSFLKDPSKMVFITILVPKSPEDSEQGFAEVEEFSRFPKEQEILFNVRSRFTVLETEDQYSQDVPCRHLVLLYGAQGFRKFVAEKSPMHEIAISKVENLSCSICQGKEKLFMPINTEKVQNYYCKKCLTSDILKAQNVPFLCVPQNKLMEKIKLQGMLMTYPINLKVPMHGYQCCKCQVKKQDMYFKCIECSSEKQNIWCEDCISSATICLEAAHTIVLESIPFSFWSMKMSQNELDHLKFQNETLEWNDLFRQAEMFLDSHEYQKAMEYSKVYIEQNLEKKQDFNVAIAYNNFGRAYYHQAKYKEAFEYCWKALEIVKLLYGDNHLHVAVCYFCLAEVYERQAEFEKALEHHFRALEIIKSFYGDDSTDIVSCDNSRGPEDRKALDYYSKILGIKKSLNGDNHPNVATSYSHIGNLYSSQADYQKALEYHSKALEIFKSFYGDNHPEVATSYSNMGNIYESQADYQKAFECYFKALETDKSFHGENHPNVATSYSNIGNIYEKQAEHQKALELHSKALEIGRSFYGENHPKVATSYNNIGNIYEKQAEYKKALGYYFKALEIDKSFYGENHPEVATSYSNIGDIYQKQAEYQKAFEYHSKALEIKKSFYGDNHPHIATSYSNMGDIYKKQAKYQKALEYHSQALDIHKSYSGESHPNVATSYHQMGSIYHFQGEYQKAFEYHSKALEIDKSFYGDNHPKVATCYSNMGNIFLKQADYQKAFEYYSKALDIYKSYFGENHPNVATSYHQIGSICHFQGEYQKALEYFSQALEIRKSFYGDNHPNVAACYNFMGNICENQGEPEKAIELYSKTLEIGKSFYSENHPDVATSYGNLGNVYNRQAKYQEALECYSKTLQTYKSFYGENHPNVAICYSNMGGVYQDQVEYQKAYEYYSKAEDILKQFFEEDHPDTIIVKNKIKKLVKVLKDKKKSES